MKYSLPTDSASIFLSELNKIRRGIHPSFKGDGIYNADALLLRLCSENPVGAMKMAIEIVCVESDFHPARIEQIRKQIIKNVNSQK